MDPHAAIEISKGSQEVKFIPGDGKKLVEDFRQVMTSAEFYFTDFTPMETQRAL